MEESPTKSRLTGLTNDIVSAAATLIAVIALCTAVYQAKLMRDQSKAAVWPYLIQGSSGNNGFARIIQNVGLGPAVIRGFEVMVDGKPLRTWKEVAESLHIAPSWRGEKSTTFRAGLVLPTNTLTELIELPDTADVRLFRSGNDRVVTWVCYCSLFGDCWTARSDETEPKPTTACVDDPIRKFRN
jgi:hypothetical protein